MQVASLNGDEDTCSPGSAVISSSDVYDESHDDLIQLHPHGEPRYFLGRGNGAFTDTSRQHA